MGFVSIKIQDSDEIDIYIVLPLGSKCYRTQYDSIKKAITDCVIHYCII